jgi:anti-sigma regulatory factor (Ser/Thr protein kinase)
MDWYLSGDDLAGVGALRHQIRAYLIRHAEPGTDVADPELIVQELLTNAVTYGTGHVWVRLSWTAQQPEIDVWDLGPGFSYPSEPVRSGDAASISWSGYAAAGAAATVELPDTDSEGGRGLFLVTHLTSQFEVAARRGGGTHVRARLPVSRVPSRSFGPRPLSANALPGLDEAETDGSFGREPFLRALVVQLSQAIEDAAGPETAEEVIAQVGIGVGGQMETAYRLARHLTGQLTPEQLAECYVRLKHAIDGRFHVIEITDQRIVLGNTQCPFGDAVKAAPALCRMTSSVFGGIAARNRGDGAAVVLEERIAVGDPGCRVVVHLGAPPEQAARFAHRYDSPADVL